MQQITKTLNGVGLEGRVAQVTPNHIDILTDNGLMRAHRRRLEAVVGDSVRYVVEHNEARILEKLPRSTELSRPDPGNPHKQLIIAANIDLLVIVVTAKEPTLRVGLIDRFIARATEWDIPAAVALNKTDLLTTEELAKALQALQPYIDLGMQVVPCSTNTGNGIDGVMELLAGKTCALCGHSGVGKSSLLRALVDGVTALVRPVNTQTGKGRHTTSNSTLIPLPGGGALIDTPGIRSLGLEVPEDDGPKAFFPEFARLNCRFPNCKHVTEPGCAVRKAVANGRLARARYDAYLKMVRDSTHEPPSKSDGFICAACGAQVSPTTEGTQHRNHCPNCLCSKHVDEAPGDRSSGCHGTMEPVAVWVRRNSEWALIHRCTECGCLKSNRVAPDDNEAMLLSLAVRPLAKTPFPLERMALGAKL